MLAFATLARLDGFVYAFFAALLAAGALGADFVTFLLLLLAARGLACCGVGSCRMLDSPVVAAYWTGARADVSMPKRGSTFEDGGFEVQVGDCPPDR